MQIKKKQDLRLEQFLWSLDKIEFYSYNIKNLSFYSLNRVREINNMAKKKEDNS